MNIGRHLQEHRERRGMTLRQIADSTKLSTTTLQHIERNDFVRLPGGIFIRGYLRAFAAEVGANAEQVVREYVVQFPPAPAVEAPPRARAIDLTHHLAVRVTAAVLALLLALFAYGSIGDSPEPASPHAVEPLHARPIMSLGIQAAASDALTAIERETGAETRR